jgi:Peptidase A4 family
MPLRMSGSAGKRLTTAVTLCAALGAVFTSTASASPVTGQLLKLGPKLSANTNTSDNWFGYNLGTLADGDTLFNSISGSWTVPTATQHNSGTAEDSADWIGIGGGCVDSGCDVTDNTLIQTGTEQDVSSTGATSYDAWYELVPAPELEITSMTVNPGDQMHASISQVVGDADVWDITISDLTTGQSYSTTLPYPSTMDTAEWIEETPLEIGTDAGFAALPNLTDPAFNSAEVNGSPVQLNTSEEMQLVDSNGDVIGTPSAPTGAGDAFSECTWTSVCG